MKHLIYAFGLTLALPVHAFGYFTDFESGVGSEWSTSTTSGFNATTILGQFDNSSTTLTLSGFSAGDTVTVSFDLYILDSWDGQNGTFGPDRFKIAIDSVDMLDTTFSNITDPGWEQNYPDGFSGGLFTAQTGADDRDLSHGGTLPDGYFGNTLYRFGGSLNPSFTGVATGSTMMFSWTGSGLQGVGDEGWGIDNVRVSAVPEPTSILAFGGALVGYFRSRRK